MNYYASLNEMWNDAVDRILYDGKPQASRDGDSSEVIAWSGMLLNCEYNFLINPVRKCSPAYACAELLWYLAGEQNIDRILAYAPQYSRFAEDGKAWGAYGYRMIHDINWLHERSLLMQRPGSQLKGIIELLKFKPDSRQAVISLWNAGDLAHAIAGDKKDIPCTLSLQFLIRQGHLHLIATMRSNDVYLGLPYDVWAFTSLQRFIADSLKVPIGTYTHQTGSLHIYTRNLEKTKHARNEACNGRAQTHGWTPLIDCQSAVQEALELETGVRAGTKGYAEVRAFADRYPGTMIADLLQCCAAKWFVCPFEIQSKILRAAQDDNR